MLQECLRDLRVLDLSQYIPGPFATLMMADLGAEVIKIEPPQGDPMALFEPRDADGVSPFYKQLNRNKTVVRLDLKGEDGRAAFTRMVEQADVVLESFRPGALDRLGFGPDRLREINPAVVHCALSGFGQTGPYRLRAGHDMTYLALTGALAATGPAAAPVMPFPPLADHAGALHAVIAVLGALLRRQRDGQGCSLDLSLFEGALHLNYLGLTLGRMAGGLAREGDMLNGATAFYRCYRCRDGRFAALGAIEPKFWRAFCEAVGRPDWVDRQAEPLPQNDLAQAVATLFAERDLDDWVALLADVDCCFEPVLEPERVPDHAHVAARGLVGAATADGAVDILFPALMDGAPPPARRPLAQATAGEILARWS